MIYTFPVLLEAPLLHLALRDVLMIEPGDAEPVGLFRALPLNYATLLPVLVEQGVVATNLTSDDLACLARLSRPPCTAELAPRSGTDRRQRLLRLVGE